MIRFGFADEVPPSARPSNVVSIKPPSAENADRERQYALGALRSEAAKLASTSVGRNGRLNTAAYTCAAYVNTGSLTREEVENALTDAARAASVLGDHPLTDREIDATLRSGLDSGERDGIVRYAPDGGQVVKVPPGGHATSDARSNETAVIADNVPKLWRATDLRSVAQPRWLAKDRLPRASVTLLVGDEGIGKSLLWVWPP